jgi:hypothetical protein
MEIFMRNLEMTEVGFVAGGLEGSSDPRQLVVQDLVAKPTEWGADWIIRYDSGGSWIDTGYSCMQLQATPDKPGFFESAYNEAASWLVRMIDRCELTTVGIPSGITFDCSRK